jgi:hypothetical protein
MTATSPDTAALASNALKLSIMKILPMPQRYLSGLGTSSITSPVNMF